ncbi:MAG: DUF2029 domain-containing protein [Candidatus Omnitrophica bacterium]|jgi:hypothetical protein|nr:DUF2029 domain-containing protein [Candidatus Omnitrophota bacterium]
MSKRRIIITGLIAIIFIALFFRYAHRAPKRHYCDFRVYYNTAQRFLAKENIYSRPDESITPFKYSAVFALITSPLAVVSQKQASLIFFTISFLLLILTCVLSKKMIVERNLSPGQNFIIYFFPVFFSSRFIFAVLDSGQVNIMIFALIIAGLYLSQKERDISAAALIALSVMFKYTSIIFLPYFLIRRKIKLSIFMILFMLFYCFIPAAYVGINTNSQYLKNWLPFITETSLDKGSWYDAKNQSLYSFILRTFSADSSFNPIAQLTFMQALAISAAIGMLIYLLIIVKKKNNETKVIDYALLFLCTALFNPNAWLVNFVIFVFAYMVIIRHLLTVKFKDKITLIFMVLSFISSSWAAESVVGDNLQKFFESLSTVTIAALILVVILLYLKFSRGITKFQDTITKQ